MIKIKEVVIEPNKIFINDVFKLKLKIQSDRLLKSENSKTIISENNKKILLEWRE